VKSINFFSTAVLLIGLLINCTLSYGQATAPPSPNATSTVSTLGGYDINLYSGKLTYTASIKNFTLGKMNFPLGVSYSSSGIRVQDIPGSVGLGWNLTLGGAITRYVVGSPDESTEGYCGPNARGAENYYGQNKSYYDNLLSGFTDGTPDKFYFSFMGYSGLFMLDPYGNPVLQSSYGLKILYSPFNRVNGRSAGGNEEWIIGDQLGNQYYFNVTEQNATTTYSENNSSKTFSCISAWYISKIVTQSNETISFSYNSGSEMNYYSLINTLHRSYASNGNETDTYYNSNVLTDVTAPKYLSQISCSSFQLNLKYDLDRIDYFGSKALTEVDAVQNNNEKYTYLFHYSYFVSNVGAETRLKLDGISQVSPSTGQPIYLYSFDYNTAQNLPQRNSIQTDYLGLYNSNPGSSNIQNYLGGDKTPDPTRTAANILTTVTNANGGKTNFTFEQNSYYSGSNVIQAPGLRIKKITSTLNNAEVNSLTYSYLIPGTSNSSGLQIENTYNYTISGYNSYSYSEPVESLFDLSGIQIGYSYVTTSKSDGSSIQYQFTDLNAYPDYKEVSYNYNFAVNTDTQTSFQLSNYLWAQTKTSLAFARGKILSLINYNSNHLITKQVNYNYTLSNKTGDIIGVNVLPDYFYLAGIYAYDRGTYHFFTQDLLLTSKTETTNIYNGLSLTNSLTQNESYTYVASYPNLLQSTTRTLSNGNTEKTYLYYPFDVLNYLLPIGGNVNRPMLDLVLRNIIGQPVATLKTVVANGVETVSSADLTTFLVTGSGLVKPYEKFRWNSSTPVLLSNYTPYVVNGGFQGETNTMDSHLEPVKIFTDYDTYGNLKSTNNPYTLDGQSSVQWGYQGVYPIAQAANANNSEFYVENFEENPAASFGTAHTGDYYYSGSSFTVNWSAPANGRTYVASYWYLSSGVWKYSGLQSYNGSQITLSGGSGYDDIRIYPSDAELTTSTYEPWVGMTSITDAKGQSTYYKYDDFKRIKTVKDRYGNITKNYIYNLIAPPVLYSNALYSAMVTPNICGPNLVGVPIPVVVNAGAFTSPYSPDNANFAARVYAQNYANNNGTCMSVVYARIETSNVSSSYDLFHDESIDDIYVRLYSDLACTIPYSPPTSITVLYTITESDSYSSGGPSIYTNNYTITVPALSNSVYLGQYETMESNNDYDGNLVGTNFTLFFALGASSAYTIEH